MPVVDHIPIRCFVSVPSCDHLLPDHTRGQTVAAISTVAGGEGADQLGIRSARELIDSSASFGLGATASKIHVSDSIESP